jgi:hypothetical protein
VSNPNPEKKDKKNKDKKILLFWLLRLPPAYWNGWLNSPGLC